MMCFRRIHLGRRDRESGTPRTAAAKQLASKKPSSKYLSWWNCSSTSFGSGTGGSATLTWFRVSEVSQRREVRISESGRE